MLVAYRGRTPISISDEGWPRLLAEVYDQDNTKGAVLRRGDGRWYLDGRPSQVVRPHVAMKHRAGLGMQEKLALNAACWLLHMCHRWLVIVLPQPTRRHHFAVGRVACYILCPRDNRLVGNFRQCYALDSQAYQRRCRFPARTTTVHDDKSKACQTRLSPVRLLISHATIMPLGAEISVVCRPRECSAQQTGPATTHG
jgi:hypothetical protein